MTTLKESKMEKPELAIDVNTKKTQTNNTKEPTGLSDSDLYTERYKKNEIRIIKMTLN